MESENKKSKRKCQNPYGTHAYAVYARLSNLNEQEVANGRQLLNYDWLTTDTSLCNNCLNKLKSQIEAAKPNTSPSTNNNSDASFEASSTTTGNHGSQESTWSQGSSQDSDTLISNHVKIINLANHLDIPLPNKLSSLNTASTNYRETTTVNLLKEILSKVKSIFPEQIGDVDLSSEIYQNLKEEFASTKTKEVKTVILKSIPKRFPSRIVAEEFKTTLHAVQKARKEPLEEPSNVGRRSITPDQIQKVTEFYLRYGVSKELPGRKDCKKVILPDGSRVKIQKRLLLNTLDALHEQYLADAKEDETTVSLTKFKELRPKYCVPVSDAAALTVCVCMTHANTEYMVEALQKTGKFRDMDPRKKALDLRQYMLCPEKDQTDACFFRECEKCIDKKVSDFIEEELATLEIDEIKYEKWITNPRPEQITVTQEMDSFLEELDRQFETFIIHQYKCSKQTTFIEHTKKKLMPGKELIIQMDFAERYTCVAQNAIQSTYFSSNSVCIHPIAVYFTKRITDANNKTTIKQDDDMKKYIVISDTKDQNTNAVYTFLKKLINQLQKDFPDFDSLFV